jgi:hypothetical protein
MIKRSNGGDSDAVEQTKSHGTIAFRMVARWPHSAKDPLLGTIEHRVHARKYRPGGEFSRTETRRAHPSIGIQRHNAFLGARPTQKIHMGLTVGSENARGWYRLRLNDLEILGKADL